MYKWRGVGGVFVCVFGRTGDVIWRALPRLESEGDKFTAAAHFNAQVRVEILNQPQHNLLVKLPHIAKDYTDRISRVGAHHKCGKKCARKSPHILGLKTQNIFK